MPDEPPKPASASASISDSTISASTVNQTTIDQRGQQVGTQYNAAGNITVTPWQPRWEPSAAEAQALLDALPRDRVPEISALPSGSRMPFAPNPHFVGRDETLLALATALHGGARVAIGPKAAVAGIGGVGKTSVAVEVAHRLGSFFAGGVFWLSFADPAAIPSEIAACGGPGMLDLHPSYGDLKQNEQLALVRQAWMKPIPRLLIFDNCEQPELVREWAPASGGCRVLVTSRRQTWPSSLGMTALSLDVLTRPASVALLRDLAPRLTPEEADEIAKELGDFPLALQLAGSYLAQFGRISVATYLAELRSDVILAHPSLRGLHDGDVSTTAHDRHVGRTFLVSYQRLDPSRDALALALLARAACLAPDAQIPQELLCSCLGLDSAKQDVQAAFQRLVNLGLLTTTELGVQLHRLVASLIQVITSDPTTLESVENTLIKWVTITNGTGYPFLMLPFLPHLRWIIRAFGDRNDVRIASLCNALGYHFVTKGIYEDALPLYERALTIRKQILGNEHPDTAISLNNLAFLLQEKGDYELSYELYIQSLEIRKKLFGEFHPHTIQSLHNIAGILYFMKDYVESCKTYERVIDIYKSDPDKNILVIGQTLNNLAVVLESMEMYNEALSLYEESLSIRKKTLSENHPITAVTIGNLGRIWDILGDDQKSRPLYEQALKIHQRNFGETHPLTAIGQHNLAKLLYKTGDTELAKNLMEQALKSLELRLGINHPDTRHVQTSFHRLFMDESASSTDTKDTK